MTADTKRTGRRAWLLVAWVLAGGCDTAPARTDADQAIEACARLHFCNVGWVNAFRINDCVTALDAVESSPAAFVECAANADSCEELYACQECAPLAELECVGDASLADCVNGLPVVDTCSSCQTSDFGMPICSAGTCSGSSSLCVGDTVEACWGNGLDWYLWTEDCSEGDLVGGTCADDGGVGPECVSSPLTACEADLYETWCDGEVVVGCGETGWELRVDCARNNIRTVCLRYDSGFGFDVSTCGRPDRDLCPIAAPVHCEGNVLRACLDVSIAVDCGDLGGVCVDSFEPYCSTDPIQAPSF